VSLKEVTRAGGDALEAVLADPKHSRRLPRIFEVAGYSPVPNPDAKDGRWKVGTSRETVYARSDLSPAEREQAARNLSHSRADKRAEKSKRIRER
jgi:hypothetical protein